MFVLFKKLVFLNNNKNLLYGFGKQSAGQNAEKASKLNQAMNQTFKNNKMT